MPDWITIIIVLLIVGIVLDGVRRMRIRRRENLRLSRRARLADRELGDDPYASASEFPSGGARVAAQRDEEEVLSLNKNVRESFSQKKVTKGAPRRIPEQVKLNLDEAVPMLMDSVDVETKASTGDSADSDAEDADTYFATDSAQDDLGILASDPGTDDDEETFENTFGHKTQTPQASGEDDSDESDAEDGFYSDDDRYQDDNDEDHYHASRNEPEYREPEQEEFSAREREPSLGSLDDLDDLDQPLAEQEPEPKPVAEEPTAATSKDKKAETRKKSPESDKTNDKNEAVGQPDEVLIINVMARKGYHFAGEALQQVLLDQNMKFGDMDIFHRHTDEEGSGPVMFSLANMVVPGTFNLAEMDNFTTPGVSLFLSLPVKADSIEAFDTMAATARALAAELDGELKDENRSVMTKQTIEHARQRVVEYERKRKLRSR